MSLRSSFEEEAAEVEREYQRIQDIAAVLAPNLDDLRWALRELGLLEDPDWLPTSDDIHDAQEAMRKAGPPGRPWVSIQMAAPGVTAKTIGWIGRNGWPGYDRDGRFIPPTKEDTMATKKVEGKHTLEVTERELYELRQGIRKREHELELAHEYMKNKGLSTASPDERLLILRGQGPDQPGLMHRLGFVESEIKSAPETEDPDQLELVKDEEADDG